MNNSTNLMSQNEYLTMYHVEKQHWWYLGLQDFAFSMLNEIKMQSKPQSKTSCLDAGCGTGAVYEAFKNSFSFMTGFDLSIEAIKLSHSRGLQLLQLASITNLPYQDNKFDIVISFDVLCILKFKNRMKALKEIRRVLKPGGFFIFNLPAYSFLKSEHDVAVHTSMRYNKKRLQKELIGAGFMLKKTTYRNMFLFPPIALIRLMNKLFLPKKNLSEIRSDLKLNSIFVNKTLYLILKLENYLIRRINLPFGLSLSGYARK